jgi:hypothetical protein
VALPVARVAVRRVTVLRTWHCKHVKKLLLGKMISDIRLTIVA